ncbi:sensor histidine kinase [Kocuria tytonis]|uniref:Sensor histidine kinase n=1 Tax=Kocuria tytonis TaxID=2054280 RepID=A0A495A1M3_9MICC|nr:sensor histidine kinase [Kocuria tytonis]RKQ33379.1 sensor histidine kinase [Kocuria tytonis]
MRQELSTPALLRIMRVTLHVSFAALLGLACLRTVMQRSAGADDLLVTATLVLAALLAATYVLGTTVENRVARGRANPGRLRWTPMWLAAVTVLWACLALMSRDFAWVVFPLFFLYPVLLPTAVALASIVLLTGVVVLSQVLHVPAGAFTAPMAVGPSIGAVVAALVSYGYRALYRDARRHRRVIRQLESTRAELARQEREAGTMTERERLSREIHDTLAQGLTSIVLVSRAAQQALSRQEVDVVAARLATIEDTAAANLAEARRFVRDLASPALEESLPAALAEVCRRTEAGARAADSGLSCEFSVQGALPDLTGPQRTLFVRAAQSTLANVLSHARASRVVVTLAGWEDAVTLDVVDDGVGFDPRGVTRHEDDDSYGISHLRRRAAELGAELTVESEPRNGTAVSVRLPLPRHAAAPPAPDDVARVTDPGGRAAASSATAAAHHRSDVRGTA